MRANCKIQILEAVKEATDWLEENAHSATTEQFEEQKEKLSNVAYPITSKLYSGSGAGGMPDYGDDEPSGHDEL
jgi:endoplasmic reticulum chaperone BiP